MAARGLAVTGIMLPDAVEASAGPKQWSHSMRLTAAEPTGRIPGGIDAAIREILTLDRGGSGLEGQLVFSVGDHKVIDIEAVIDLMLIRFAARRREAFKLTPHILLAREDHATVSWRRGPDAPESVTFCLIGVGGPANWKDPYTGF